MTDPDHKPALPAPAARVRRRTPLAAHGEPAVWLMGVALLLCLVLIVSLIGIIVVRGGRTFWPNEIQTVTLRSGETFLGQPQHAERYLPGPEERARIDELIAVGTLEADAIDEEGRAERRRYRVGNRDLGQQSFRSVPTYEIESVEYDPDALLVERRQWGVFLGVPEGVYQESTYDLGPDDEPNDAGPAIEREVIETLEDGTRRIRERRWVAKGAGETVEALPELHAEAMKRRAQIDAINEHQAPALQERLTSLAWARREAEMRASEETRRRLPVWAWIGLSVLTAGAFVLVLRWSRSPSRAPGPDRRRTVLLTLAWGGVVALAGAAVLESPMMKRGISEAELAKIEARIDAKESELRAQQAKDLATVDALRAADARWRILVREPRTDRFSPMSQSRPD
ncbi:MAG: hypothetical protein ACIARR_07385, partial [Phycisphaerales bacterium JB059]